MPETRPRRQAGSASGRQAGSASGRQAGPDLVRRYLVALAEYDWESSAGCLSPDIRRVGPFGDVYEGRDAYLAFLSSLMPTLSGYRMEVEGVYGTEDGTRVVAELVETVEMNGKTVVTPESLVFDLDDDGRIRGIRIYIQQLS